MAARDRQTEVAERQLATFHLGNCEFGADIMHVKEIVRVPVITKIPNAPAFIEGACNLRGRILPVIDGRTRLNMAKKEKDDSSRVLVIDANGTVTGILVDKVSEVLSVSSQDIEKPPQVLKHVDGNFLQGIVKLDNGRRLVMLLDVIKMAECVEAPRQSPEGQVASFAGEDADRNEVAADAYANDVDQLVSFWLGEEEYAIRIMRVREIMRVPELMKVPNCEDYVEGVASIRNDLLPVINLRAYFGMERKEITDQTRILVVDMGEFAAGLMVDRVSEVLRIHTGVIQPLPGFSSQVGDQLAGVAKLNGGKRLIMLLEPRNMLTVDEFRMIGGSLDDGTEADKGKLPERQAADEEYFVTFKIAADEFGINIQNVQEINRMPDVTKVPRAPYFIDGIVNLRGNIIPALNLRKLFGLPGEEKTDRTRIIIVDFRGAKTGIVVDSVSEVLRLDRALIEPPPDIFASGIKRDYVDGIGKINGGNRMVLILNLENVLSFQDGTS